MFRSTDSLKLSVKSDVGFSLSPALPLDSHHHPCHLDLRGRLLDGQPHVGSRDSETAAQAGRLSYPLHNYAWTLAYKNLNEQTLTHFLTSSPVSPSPTWCACLWKPKATKEFSFCSWSTSEAGAQPPASLGGEELTSINSVWQSQMVIPVWIPPPTMGFLNLTFSHLLATLTSKSDKSLLL